MFDQMGDNACIKHCIDIFLISIRKIGHSPHSIREDLGIDIILDDLSNSLESSLYKLEFPSSLAEIRDGPGTIILICEALGVLHDLTEAVQPAKL